MTSEPLPAASVEPSRSTSRVTVRPRGLVHDGTALLVLLVMAAFFFWRLWAPKPADRVAFPVGDFTDQYYPLRRFVAATLAEGRLPFWNPFIFGGQPALADPQAATLYPPALLNMLLWGGDFPLAALQLEVVAHILLAAWGTYGFIRVALRLGVFPALVGAIIFAFGGYLTGFPLEQVTIIETVAWLPWLLFAVHGATSHHASPPARMGSAAAGALALGIALLAGHPQSALYLFYLSGIYALFRWLTGAKHGRGGWAAALAVAAIFSLGVGLAAAQLLPTTAFIAESTRQSLDYQFARGGLSWDELTTLAIPKVVGSTPLYAGIATLLLAPLGLISAGQSLQKRFWGAAGLTSLLVSLGGISFLFDLAYLGLPGFSQVRSQERILLIFVWSLALLAAWGIAALTDAQQRGVLRRYSRWLANFIPVLLLPGVALWWIKAAAYSQFTLNLDVFVSFLERYSFFFLFFLLACALLAWHSHRQGREQGRWIGALWVILLMLDLFSITRSPHIGGPPEQALTARNEVVDALYSWQAEAPGRVAVVGDTTPRGNDGMRWGIPFLSGNEPLRLAAVERFLVEAQPWNQLQALAASYIVADRDLGAEEPTVYETLALAPPSSYLVRVRPPMPYSWLAPEVRRVSSTDELYGQMRQGTLDLHSTTLIEEPSPTEGSRGSAPGEVTIVERGAGYATLNVVNSTADPALLVIAEPATAGWQLELDGQPLTWLRANGVNLAAAIPPGEHTVRLRYEQPGWQMGMAISGLALVIILTMLGWSAASRKRSAGSLG